MSYDIGLYKPEFLTRAFEQQLGDWTNADPIPDEDLDAIIRLLRGKGYVQEAGAEVFGRKFRHPEWAWVQVLVNRGSVEFTVAYGGDSAKAIPAALADAREIAKLARLALYDPQAGVIEG